MKQRIQLRKSAGKTIVESEIAWKIAEEPAISRFVAVCPALNITLRANTREELFSLIPESLESLFSSLDKHGDWDAFFKEIKWAKQESRALQNARRNSPGLPPLRIESVTPHDLQLAAC
ncbi:MAG: hypothetical protein Q8N18_26980 [Opitutaceae bacterium]|nr:hypothetical protein [Opitutaceae bacterium]